MPSTPTALKTIGQQIDDLIVERELIQTGPLAEYHRLSAELDETQTRLDELSERLSPQFDRLNQIRVEIRSLANLA